MNNEQNSNKIALRLSIFKCVFDNREAANGPLWSSSHAATLLTYNQEHRRQMPQHLNATGGELEIYPIIGFNKNNFNLILKEILESF